jgi:hypothetical protein
VRSEDGEADTHADSTQGTKERTLPVGDFSGRVAGGNRTPRLSQNRT